MARNLNLLLQKYHLRKVNQDEVCNTDVCFKLGNDTSGMYYKSEKTNFKEHSEEDFEKKGWVPLVICDLTSGLSPGNLSNTMWNEREGILWLLNT